MIIVFLIDMYQEDIRTAIGRDSDSIEVTKQYSTFDFVFILEVNKFFHKGFDDVFWFEDIEDGKIGDD